MKFMKLGSRPDTFYTTEAVRTVSSEVSSDLIIQIKGTRYLLHKFPLLSKCLHLQKLCSQIPKKSSHLQILQLTEFPGGPDSFELCAKFCYGITITLSAYNIVSAICAAQYLQMTEEPEKGNLISKLEIFFNSCILFGWKDIIVTLQSTKLFPSSSEDLGITSKCVEAVCTKVSANPERVSFLRRARDEISCNGLTNWWAYDLAELTIDLYWRVMIGVKSGGRVKPNVIGEALRIYASRWLLSENEADSSKKRLLLESIISLLPIEKSAVSCSFLMKLLKVANVVRASASSKNELVRRVGLQLEEAKVDDLLVPRQQGSDNGLVYDVDVVLDILEEFKMLGGSPKMSPLRNKEGFERRRSRSAENVNLEFQESRRSLSASHGSKLKVTKLVDRYLKEIAKDENLGLGKFIDVAEAVPEFARMDHDDLYHAIDIYLKTHHGLNKSERKRLCKILDCKKLSMEACIHAAQNEMLPLRVVVQVLFFEQARAAMSGSQTGQLPSNIKALLRKTPSKPTTDQDQWSSVSGLKSPKSNISTLKKKTDEDYKDLDGNFEKPSKLKSLNVIPSMTYKKIFSKFWPIYRSAK